MKNWESFLVPFLCFRFLIVFIYGDLLRVSRTAEKLNIPSRKTQRAAIVGSFPHLSPEFQKVSVDSVDCSVF